MGACVSSNVKQMSPAASSYKKVNERLITNQKDLVLSVIPENLSKITRDYRILPTVLGRGAYGEVRKAVHLATNELRAIKVIYKQDCHPDHQEKIFKEINVLRHLDHPNIVRIYEYFHTNRFIFIVMELITGGELFDRIVSAKSLSERSAARYAEQIFQAVAYMHTQGFVHRDLKPENILCDEDLIKLVDFGTSRAYNPRKNMTTTHGTPYYIAPEVLYHDYDERCDVWSCGVILYILLTGMPPFNGRNDEDILNAVQRGKCHFDLPEFANVSEPCIDLLRKMLTYNPKKRPSMQEVLAHPWLNGTLAHTEHHVSPSALFNLSTFNIRNKMQGAIYFFLVNNMVSREEQRELLETFRALDSNGDGELSKAELQAGLKRINRFVSEAELDQIMDRIDHNRSKTINYREFVTAAVDRRKILSDERINNCFKIFDKDRSGRISLAEFKQMFKGNNMIDDAVWEELIKEIDDNNDGEIEFQEFKSLLIKMIN